jgi:hypothetical protein
VIEERVEGLVEEGELIGAPALREVAGEEHEVPRARARGEAREIVVERLTHGGPSRALPGEAAVEVGEVQPR